MSPLPQCPSHKAQVWQNYVTQTKQTNHIIRRSKFYPTILPDSSSERTAKTRSTLFPPPLTLNFNPASARLPIEIKRTSTTSMNCSHKCTVFEHFQQICVDCGGVLTDVLFGTQALDRATDYNSGVGDYVFGK